VSDAPMTWHYAIRDRRLAEVFEPSGGYCLLGWRDLPHILRDLRWVIKGIRFDRRLDRDR
jgi:hypothetical protein